MMNSCLLRKKPHMPHAFNNIFSSSFTDAVNLLSLTSDSSDTRMSMDEIGTHINQVVDKNDFTIMFTIRSQVFFVQLPDVTSENRGWKLKNYSIKNCFLITNKFELSESS